MENDHCPGGVSRGQHDSCGAGCPRHVPGGADDSLNLPGVYWWEFPLNADAEDVLQFPSVPGIPHTAL